MSKEKIVLVSYLNTLPFMHGLHHFGEFEIIRKTPSKCTESFQKGEANLALVPVGSLLELNDYSIISEYCIGCDGYVKTVEVFSNSDIKNIDTLYLDEDSRTSAMLVMVIFEKYYKIKVNYVNGLPSFPNTIKENEALLMIGDKVFEYENVFRYKMDLGLEWKNFTGLPFAFAVWVANSKSSKTSISKLGKALTYGVNNINNIDWHLQEASTFDLKDYIEKNISYELDQEKSKAIALYLELTKSILK